MKLLFILFFVVVFSLFDDINCWDNAEMQMFDLVEEVNENFYGYLGVDQNATNADIRRAYRKLSLIYHPDKNPNPEDAVKFRRLVAIYEILREDKTREKYNEVLKFGLPDWRMPAFYFRKLRKMSFVESFILFSILATLVHYACLWGVYFEQKLNMEDFLFRRKKMRNNESKMNEQLNTVYKPRWKDILPLVIVKFFYNFVVSTPENVKMTCGLVKKEISTAIDKQFEKKRKEKQREEEKKKIEEMKKQKKERKSVLSKENIEKRKIYEMGIQNAMTLPVETFNDIPTVDENETVTTEGLQLGPWTDADTVALIRGLNKFPAGVTDRWIKISDFVKRPLREVTKKVKDIQASSKEGKIPINTKMQNSLGDGVEEQFEQQVIYINPHISPEVAISDSEDEEDQEFNIKSSAQKKKERKKLAKQTILTQVPLRKSDETVVPETANQEDPSLEQEDIGVQQRKKPRTKAKYLEAPESIEANTWTQIEQKQLEDAMRAFPKGTNDRWDRISQKIPTKTKTECIERIKKLSQSILEKNNKVNQ